MGGFANSISNNIDVVFAKNGDFSGAANPNDTNGLQTNGQMWIGSTALNAGSTHINVGRITSPLGTLTIGYSSPNITIDATGGSIVNSITAGTNINLTGTATNPIINLNDPVKQTNGSAAAPPYSFVNQTSTGMYLTAGLVLGLASSFGEGVEIGFTTQTKNLLEIGAGVAFTYTSTSTSPYVVLSSDLFVSIDSSGGAKTVQLPNAPRNGQVYIIKDKTGSAAANNITVTTVGGAVTIDGSTTFVMSTNYESISVLFNGTSYEIW